MTSQKKTANYKTAEYKIWVGIKGRCFVKSNSVFAWYGGMGITLCERWKSFDNFLEDMGLMPFPRATIERINTLGNYEPSNCRWATQQEQCWNRRSGNTVLTHNGKTQCIAKWACELGLDQRMIAARKRRHWTDSDCLRPKELNHCDHYRAMKISNHPDEKL